MTNPDNLFEKPSTSIASIIRENIIVLLAAGIFILSFTIGVVIADSTVIYTQTKTLVQFPTLDRILVFDKSDGEFVDFNWYTKPEYGQMLTDELKVLDNLEDVLRKLIEQETINLQLRNGILREA